MVNILFKCMVFLKGVYVVSMILDDGLIYDGVVNIGLWLMVDGKQLVFEVYLFDFVGIFYGCYIDVVF